MASQSPGRNDCRYEESGVEIKMTGHITRVFLTRGFAFAVGEDTLEYFVHIDALAPGQVWEGFRAGNVIEFEPKANGHKQNKLRATNVKVLA